MKQKAQNKNHLFWTSLPGILTGCATFLTAVVSCIGLILAWPRPNTIFPASPIPDAGAGFSPSEQANLATPSIPETSAPRSTPVSKGGIIHGPTHGTIEHAIDGYVQTGKSANINIEDYIAQVTFQNPYDISQGIWDYGFWVENGMDGYYFFVDARSSWFVDFVWRGQSVEQVFGGKIEEMNLAAGETNTLKLTINNNIATFFVNENFVYEIELPNDLGRTNILPAIEFASYNELDNETTNYFDFVVWGVQ